MGTAFASQTAGVKVDATVYPPCADCGQAFGRHLAPGCGGYRPSRPVLEFSVGYRPPLALRWHRRLAARALWAVERRCRAARNIVDPS